MRKISTICIIDDDAVYQFAIKRAIRNYNSQIQVMAYTNAEEAVALFKETLNSGNNLPDIILVDINMPIMDGWQFLEEFAQIKSGIRSDVDIYMGSSSLDVSDISRAEANEDVTGFLLKPIDVEALFGKYETPSA